MKNHLYRNGFETSKAGCLRPIIGSNFATKELYHYQIDYLLGRVPGSYQWSWGALTTRGNVLVAPDNQLGDPINFPGSREVFHQEITTGNFDVMITSTHGSAYGIGGGEAFYDRSYLRTTPIKVTFWFESGCETANVDVVPSFGATALYSETSKVLAYVGATTPQGGLGGTGKGYFPLVIGTAFTNGKSIGEAILEHLGTPMVPPYTQQREYFVAQHILLGDGTLRLPRQTARRRAVR